jgi:hypothetical protein
MSVIEELGEAGPLTIHVTGTESIEEIRRYAESSGTRTVHLNLHDIHSEEDFFDLLAKAYTSPYKIGSWDAVATILGVPEWWSPTEDIVVIISDGEDFFTKNPRAFRLWCWSMVELSDRSQTVGQRLHFVVVGDQRTREAVENYAREVQEKYPFDFQVSVG